MELKKFFGYNETTNSLERYKSYTKTCGTQQPFVDGFLTKFQDSFCYTFFLQFLVVFLLYMNVGKGRYWKMLYYASLAGVIGATIEGLTVSLICSNNNDYRLVVTFLINEVFWILNEYSIPLLNLIKMKAFGKGTLATTTKNLIIGLAIPFIFFRFCIGYLRMTRGYLRDDKINEFHGYAFAVMAVADIVCTFAILYFVRINNGKVAIKTSNINDYIKHSSYTILLIVDVVSALLSITNILSNYIEKFPDNLFTPLHCIKCSFILILAVDAFIFKYDANISSQNESSGGNRTYGVGSDSYTNYSYNNKSSYKSRIINLNENTNNNNNNKSKSTINVTSYSYSSYDNNDYPKPESSSMNNSKTIVKNYTTSKVSDINDPYEIKIYSPQKFGFLT